SDKDIPATQTLPAPLTGTVTGAPHPQAEQVQVLSQGEVIKRLAAAHPEWISPQKADQFAAWLDDPARDRTMLKKAEVGRGRSKHVEIVSSGEAENGNFWWVNLKDGKASSNPT